MWGGVCGPIWSGGCCNDLFSIPLPYPPPCEFAIHYACCQTQKKRKHKEASARVLKGSRGSEAIVRIALSRRFFFCAFFETCYKCQASLTLLLLPNVVYSRLARIGNPLLIRFKANSSNVDSILVGLDYLWFDRIPDFIFLFFIFQSCWHIGIVAKATSLIP